MRIALRTSLVLLLLSTVLHAQDLASIERKLTREPAYRGSPEYGLLVLGTNREKTIWLVRDGDILYVDRNGNGDLTSPDARLQADAKASAPSEFEFTFNIGKLPGCPGEPSDVILATRRISALPELNEAMKQAVSRDANAVVYMLSLQTTHPQWKGIGVGGRLVHMVGPIDHRGALQFGKSAASAPVFHVGGSLQIVSYGDLPQVRAGNSCEIVSSIGTPGLGAGTTAFLGYEKTIPPDVKPTLDLIYPKGEKQSVPLQVTAVLKERCCGINLYGKLQVPDDVGSGKAQVTLKLPDWKDGNVASSESTMEILAKANKAIPQTVSLSPVKQFVHQDRQGHLFQLQFSPDASKLYAASYPNGVIQWWDATTTQQLKSIETGKGLRGSAEYSMLTPNWKEVWVGEEKRPQVEQIEIDGKKQIKWKFNGRLRSWNADTGASLDPIIPSDGRSFRQTHLSPDGQYLMALEEISGTFPREHGRQQKLSLYDMKTRQKLPFPDKYAFFTPFTADSRHIFVQETKGPPTHDHIAWHLVTIPDGKIIQSLNATETANNIFLTHHSKDMRQVYLYATQYAAPRNYQKFTQELQSWNLESGKMLSSISMGDETIRKTCLFSDDDRWMVTCTLPMPRKPSDAPSVFELYSAGDMKLMARIDLPGQGSHSATAFHPRHDVVVQVCQAFPREAYTNRDFTFNEDEIEQPKLVWIDIKKGTIVRTDTLPPSFPGRLKFSPDGKHLAMTVRGAVHLYEVPPELLK